MNSSTLFATEAIPLSEVGKQLLPIVQEESNDDYLIDLGKLLREDLQEKVDVCVYRVISRNANDLELDFSVAEISCYYYYVSVSN